MSHPESEGEGVFLLTVTSDKLLNEDGHWGCPAGEATVYWHHRGRRGVAGVSKVDQAGQLLWLHWLQPSPQANLRRRLTRIRIACRAGRQSEGTVRYVSEALAVSLMSICINSYP